MADNFQELHIPDKWGNLFMEWNWGSPQYMSLRYPACGRKLSTQNFHRSSCHSEFIWWKSWQHGFTKVFVPLKIWQQKQWCRLHLSSYLNHLQKAHRWAITAVPPYSNRKYTSCVRWDPGHESDTFRYEVNGMHSFHFEISQNEIGKLPEILCKW